VAESARARRWGFEPTFRRKSLFASKFSPEATISAWLASFMNARQSSSQRWEYFQDVITWVRENFTNYRKEKIGVNWGELFNQFKDKKLNAAKLETEISELMQDEDVTKKSGIYPYVLTRQEKYLSIRAFTDKMKREAYERQHGKCSFCKKKFDISEMEAYHLTPWHEGGKTLVENCQMLRKDDNRRKSGK
jgi:hypothetical protein